MSSSKHTRLLIGGATIALAAMAAPAFAADAATTKAAEPATGEIIVTAQRRAEKVAEVPISITVADAAQLERQQVDTVNDLNRIAPSLEIQGAPGQNTGGGGAIRGIGTQTFNAGATASVGIVVDQVSQGNANISDLFDLARVEVLKGPQGTLFGLTTSAGVINITTNKPEFNTFSLRVRTELSSAGTAGSKFGDQVLQGVVNIPLAANAALRWSGSMNLRQGVDRNAYTGKLNDVNDYATRAHLRWEPSSDVSVNLIGDYTHAKSTGEGDFFTFVKADGPGVINGLAPFPILDVQGLAGRLASCGVVAAEGNQNYCSNQVLTTTSDNYGVSLNLEKNLGWATLTSITAYRGLRTNSTGGNILRADTLGIEILDGPQEVALDLVTQELRLSSPGGATLEYTVGAFASSQKTVQTPQAFNVFLDDSLQAPFGTPTPANGFNPFVPLPPAVAIPNDSNRGLNPVNSLGNRNDVTDRSIAAFGQVTWHATDKLRLIAGGRYTSERLALASYNLDTSSENDLVLQQNRFSWRLGAQYDIAHHVMGYLTANHGYKGGQIAIPGAGQANYVVQPEIPTAFEGGIKATLLGSWIADFNVFYEKIHGFQAQQCIVDAQAALVCDPHNIDGVKSRGAELNLFGKVTRNLSLNTGLIWAKATYPTGYTGTDSTNIGGTQLGYAPEYKFTLSGEYTVPVTSQLNGFFAADTVWKSKLRYEENSVAASTFRAHWNIGGRIGIRTDDQRFTAAVFVRNLGNVHEPLLLQSNLPANGAAELGAMYGPMSFRQVGLSLDARF